MIQATASNPIQAFPIKKGTGLFTSGVTAYEIKGQVIVHAYEDCVLKAYYNGGNVSVDLTAGSDWAISHEFMSIDVTGKCVITPA